MRSSAPFSQPSIWKWMFWTFGLYSILELALFVVIGLVARKSVGELVGPYLAFAAPASIVLALVWWLKNWEKRGASPRRLALGWCLSAVFFFSGTAIALVYSGIVLRLVDQRNIVIFVVACVAGVFVVSFSAYFQLRPRIFERAARNADDAGSR